MKPMGAWEATAKMTKIKIVVGLCLLMAVGGWIAVVGHKVQYVFGDSEATGSGFGDSEATCFGILVFILVVAGVASFKYKKRHNTSTYCTNCGSRIPDAFCSNCGKPKCLHSAI